ncbi:MULTISPECIES: hypothetical protein [unclassified Microbacterium]|nr:MULTISPECIES: hypothetical protein [unclassified Microbacterium]MCR2810316.1 hypothetical protein [Microbacterium sp. zg.B185]WIM18376.1 hypothetical protein QNO12_12310 [Microbacterium sp. zg-B185]
MASGSTLSAIEETLARVLEDEISRGVTRERRAGLTPSEEMAVLRAVR